MILNYMLCTYALRCIPLLFKVAGPKFYTARSRLTKECETNIVFRILTSCAKLCDLV